MKPGRWWSVILPMALLMALSPLSAQAGGPNLPFAQQPNRQAVTQPQPRAFAPQMNRQAFTSTQPRASVSSWNNQPHQWQQPRGNAYGWNNHQRQGDQDRDAYGRNGQNHQWQQPRGDAYGWNNQQRQWQQPRPSTAQGDRPGNQQFQPTYGGQLSNSGPSYNRAGYPTQAQSPNSTPRWSGYDHNTTMPASQTGAQPGFRHPEPAGNAPQPIGQSPSGSI